MEQVDKNRQILKEQIKLNKLSPKFRRFIIDEMRYDFSYFEPIQNILQWYNDNVDGTFVTPNGEDIFVRYKQGKYFYLDMIDADSIKHSRLGVHVAKSLHELALQNLYAKFFNAGIFNKHDEGQIFQTNDERARESICNTNLACYIHDFMNASDFAISEDRVYTV